MNDWEQVTPFLQEMQHCNDDDYFHPQEVSRNRFNTNKKMVFLRN